MDEIRLSASTGGDGLSPSTSAAIKNAHEKLEEEPDRNPKYSVDLSDAKGVVVGDNASQTNNFG
ncbi:hypothetical protein GCM10022267_80420 [Lentzea roselyniae]|uniref:Uncharacterized protein n=1 Tax=Lentzea roselyniae TaxID=531940 RepID=A0ABP7C6H3_9PSEU